MRNACVLQIMGVPTRLHVCVCTHDRLLPIIERLHSHVIIERLRLFETQTRVLLLALASSI